MIAPEHFKNTVSWQSIKRLAGEQHWSEGKERHVTLLAQSRPYFSHLYYIQRHWVFKSKYSLPYFSSRLLIKRHMNKIRRTKFFTDAGTKQNRRGSLDEEELRQILRRIKGHLPFHKGSWTVHGSSKPLWRQLTSMIYYEHTECPRGYRRGTIVYLSIGTTVVTSKFNSTENEHFIRVNSTFIQWS